MGCGCRMGDEALGIAAIVGIERVGAKQLTIPPGPDRLGGVIWRKHFV